MGLSVIIIIYLFVFEIEKMFWAVDEVDGWVAASLLEEIPSRNIVKLTMPSGKVVETNVSDCIPISNPQDLNDAPHDLISLSEVNEPSILNSIRLRFLQQNIYTCCGSVLMVLNPFATIDNLYGPDQIDWYKDPYAEGLLPHIYIISSRAYALMCSFGKNQSILIR